MALPTPPLPARATTPGATRPVAISESGDKTGVVGIRSGRLRRSEHHRIAGGDRADRRVVDPEPAYDLLFIRIGDVEAAIGLVAGAVEHRVEFERKVARHQKFVGQIEAAQAGRCAVQVGRL